MVKDVVVSRRIASDLVLMAQGPYSVIGVVMSESEGLHRTMRNGTKAFLVKV